MTLDDLIDFAAFIALAVQEADGRPINWREAAGRWQYMKRPTSIAGDEARRPRVEARALVAEAMPYAELPL